MISLLFECFDIVHNINEYISMLWSLWIIYILFAENFKAKINTNIFRFKTFIFLMVSKKSCLHIIAYMNY